MKLFVFVSLAIFSLSSFAQFDGGDYSGLGELRTAFINNLETKNAVVEIEHKHNVGCEARYWAPRFGIPSEFVQTYRCFGEEGNKRVRIFANYDVEATGYKFSIIKIKVR